MSKQWECEIVAISWGPGTDPKTAKKALFSSPEKSEMQKAIENGVLDRDSKQESEENHVGKKATQVE